MTPTKNNYSDWLDKAHTLAQKAADLQEVPVGCIIIHPQHTIIAQSYNQKEMYCNATFHAEILALQQASLYTHSWRLEHCILICTLEPCLMCLGAILEARIATLIYGAQNPKSGALSKLLIDPNTLPFSIHFYEHPPSAQILTSFFAKLRE